MWYWYTYIVPIGGGLFFAAWFARIAIQVRRRGNGDRDREPVLWALTWLGIAVAINHLVLWQITPVSLDWARQWSRLWLPITGLVPLGVIVTHLMRQHHD